LPERISLQTFLRNRDNQQNFYYQFQNLQLGIPFIKYFFICSLSWKPAWSDAIAIFIKNLLFRLVILPQRKTRLWWEAGMKEGGLIEGSFLTISKLEWSILYKQKLCQPFSPILTQNLGFFGTNWLFCVSKRQHLIWLKLLWKDINRI